MMKKPLIWAAALLLLPLSEALPQNVSKMQVRLSTKLSAPEVAGVRGGISTLSVDVTAHLRSPEIAVELALPNELTLLGGSATQRLNLIAGETQRLTLQVRATAPGIYHVQVRAADTTQLDIPNLLPSTSDEITIAIGTEKAFASKLVDARFTPVGLKNLQKRMEPIPVPASTISGGHTVYHASPPGRSMRGRNVNLEVKRLQDLGVDALFEDSTLQTARMMKALQDDSASDAPSANSSSNMVSISSGSTCPAGSVQRPGKVQFWNYNAAPAGYVGLGGVRVEAWDRYDHTGNGYIFYTLPDGSFPSDACFPYDVNGWTHLFMFQQNRYITVDRDGESNGQMFPNGWNQTWDLNASSYITVTANHPEAAYLLYNTEKAIPYGNQEFGMSRPGLTTVWLYKNTDLNHYCPFYFPFFCTKTQAEGIYFHIASPSQNGPVFPMVWTAWGQRSLIHEYGHAFADKALSNLGAPSCGFGHTWDEPNSPDCALDEGFAEFYSVFTFHPERYSHYQNLEYGNWGGPRGPEIEATVATYFYDLVDTSTYPSTRETSWGTDEPVSISANYLARILRDGRVGGNKPRSVMDVIALIDNITPVPSKSEFAAYSQPSSITTSVTPAPLDAATNAHVWRWNLFKTAPPSGIGFAFVQSSLSQFLITANAPEAVTTKTTYSLSGSASHTAYGWNWTRSDDGGAVFSQWQTSQNSSFIAYAGIYNIDWRLDAVRSADGATNYSVQRTAVCIDASCSSPPPEFKPITGPTIASAISANSPVSKSSDGVHFGSGVWVAARRSDRPVVTQLYSLAGTHERNESAQSTIFSDGTITSKPLANLPVTVGARKEAETGNTMTTSLKITGQAAYGNYAISIALDPDLGFSAADDSLGVDASGLVWVVDADSAAVGYVVEGIPTNAITVRQFSTNRMNWNPDPSSETSALAEMRATQTRLTKSRDDVRFILNLGEYSVDAGKQIRIHLLRGKSLAEVRALAARMNPRNSEKPPVELPAKTLDSFQLVQAPPTETLPSTLPMSVSASIVPALGMSDGVNQVSLESAVRAHGINSVAFNVPGSQSAHVRIRIIDPAGRFVKTLTDADFTPGVYRVDWDSNADSGVRVSPGVYTAIMEAPGFIAKTKLVVIR